jgi:hypothetical protein
MKTFVLRSGMAFIVSAFTVPIFILVIVWKKAGPSDGFAQLAAIAYAFWAGVGLLICGIILSLIGIFVKD